jgi:hypothetical protein
MKPRYSVLVALLAVAPSSAVFACATCGCSLSSDAAMGYSTSSGWMVSLEYEYFNQNRLRSGTGAIRARWPTPPAQPVPWLI